MRVSYKFNEYTKSINNIRSVDLVINSKILILHLYQNANILSTISIKGECDKPSKFKNETSIDTIYQELLELGYIDLSSFKLELIDWEDNEKLGNINLGD